MKYSKKILVVIVFICIMCLFYFIFRPKSEKSLINESSTDKYAVRMLDLNLSNISKVDDFMSYGKNIDINIPQVYYLTDFEDTNSKIKGIENKINKNLLYKSLGSNSMFINGDGLDSNTKEYKLKYSITKSNNEILSIKFFGHLYAIDSSMELCYAITINPLTGEEIPLPKNIKINEELVEKVKTGQIQFESLADLSKEEVIEYLEIFIDRVKEPTELEYYLDNQYVNIIFNTGTRSGKCIILKIHQ